MRELKIILAPNNVLTTRSQEVKGVDGGLRRLISDLKYTLSLQAEPEGVGIAAPQVGQSLRLFVLRDEETRVMTTYLNPEIMTLSAETYEQAHPEDDQILEGCLSVPDIYGKITRANSIEVKFLDETGQPQEEEMIGLKATYFQHEYDHLEGILFTTRVLAEGNQLFRLVGEHWHKIKL